MKARPKIENLKKFTQGYTLNLYQISLAVTELDSLEQWANEAQVSLNAGDYLMAEQRKQIKELSKYINHQEDCEMLYLDGKDECTCGFNKLNKH